MLRTGCRLGMNCAQFRYGWYAGLYRGEVVEIADVLNRRTVLYARSCTRSHRLVQG